MSVKQTSMSFVLSEIIIVLRVHLFAFLSFSLYNISKTQYKIFVPYYEALSNKRL